MSFPYSTLMVQGTTSDAGKSTVVAALCRLLKPSSDIGAQVVIHGKVRAEMNARDYHQYKTCLLYTSPSPRDLSTSRMPSSA